MQNLIDGFPRQLKEAIEIGRSGLRLFGERLPGSPGPLHLFTELALVRSALGRRSASQLYALPTMADSDRIAAIRLLMSICPAAYFQNPDLMSFAALRIMRISLKHGNATLIQVGGGNVSLVSVPLENRPWHETTEVAEIQRFDVGIMPLPDEPFERGKCGYKLIQYMACGLPVIASPIGVNRAGSCSTKPAAAEATEYRPQSP